MPASNSLSRTPGRTSTELMIDNLPLLTHAKQALAYQRLDTSMMSCTMPAGAEERSMELTQADLTRMPTVSTVDPWHLLAPRRAVIKPGAVSSLETRDR